ncbi:phosphatidylinositol N-acetylglucosaminyltransferase subunit gpi15 [Staphylotrichum tortipilum]|uniref:Phosphatidylinositol N-acetylglucosaminyltransferase subunit gpi15 n=1 Tax=Staphylotrichum tortipilum TaxID=2831512 RepID=A0AAN6MI62_9PEZI|nr:phosphatidylinositol N-acetylglucosaminyltransferase subunit gpi15 [Staphylotrichum longicolle]
MLTTAPHLYIRRPSPTTAEFTVTTCPPPSLPLRLLQLTLLLLRLITISLALLALHARFGHDLPLSTASLPPFLANLLQPILSSAPATLLTRLAAQDATPDWLVAGTALGAVYGALAFRPHTTESVLVLRGLGIQTSTTSGGGGWGVQTRFIPTEKIRDVLINEAFRGFGVRYYLVVVVEGEEDVVVLFPGLLPRRRIVEAVWRGVRGCLWEGGEEGKG